MEWQQVLFHENLSHLARAGRYTARVIKAISPPLAAILAASSFLEWLETHSHSPFTRVQLFFPCAGIEEEIPPCAPFFGQHASLAASSGIFVM